jgi:hypothetical protein
MIKKALFGLAVLLGKKVITKVARKAAGKVAEKVLKRSPGR